MEDEVRAYCGRCNERAEMEISWTMPVSVLVSDFRPGRDYSGTIRCLGCDPWLHMPNTTVRKHRNEDPDPWGYIPSVTIREGRDEGYELLWLREALWEGL